MTSSGGPATVETIAPRAETSIASVSGVLWGHEARPDTVRRVQRAVSELGYVRARLDGGPVLGGGTGFSRRTVAPRLVVRASTPGASAAGRTLTPTPAGRSGAGGPALPVSRSSVAAGSPG
jgi:hypothetical protein